MAYPANYRYTREHEWISVDGNIGTVGITDYAQNSLGDIVYVDMPKVGDTIGANATFGSVESSSTGAFQCFAAFASSTLRTWAPNLRRSLK